MTEVVELITFHSLLWTNKCLGRLNKDLRPSINIDGVVTPSDLQKCQRFSHACKNSVYVTRRNYQFITYLRDYNSSRKSHHSIHSRGQGVRWGKYGIFFRSGAKILYRNLIWKSPGFDPFGVNLTHFGDKFGHPAPHSNPNCGFFVSHLNLKEKRRNDDQFSRM